MPKPAINRDTVSGEALFILRSLKENGRQGRSNKLADVKAALEPSVSQEFDSYFFFLRKYHYIAMDREAQLRLTEQGERAVGGDQIERFQSEVGEFFADQLAGGGMKKPVVEEAPSGDTKPAIVLDDENLMAPITQVTPPPAPPAAAPAPAPTPSSSRRRVVSGEAAAAASSASSHASPEPAAPAAQAAHSSSSASAPMAPSSASSPAAATASRSTEQERYQRFDPIGSGPLGTVFKGRHNPLSQDVCIKELKDIFGYFSFMQRSEVLKRLRKELCAQAQVRHPSVVQVLDQNMEAPRPYFVVELLRGSLREQMDATSGKGVAVNFALRWFLQLAYGLRAAHGMGHTHHNLKPENILFDACGNAKLSDFGLSRVVEVDATKGMPQVIVGTGGMAYMAPELLQRQPGKEANVIADVYGLGILFYEMVTGQLPGRRSPLPSEINPECPAGLDTVFDRMTQDRLEQRYPDIDAVLNDFYEVFPQREYLARGDLILSSDMQ